MMPDRAVLIGLSVRSGSVERSIDHCRVGGAPHDPNAPIIASSLSASCTPWTHSMTIGECSQAFQRTSVFQNMFRARRFAAQRSRYSLDLLTV